MHQKYNHQYIQLFVQRRFCL